jgi:hypothetical protein
VYIAFSDDWTATTPKVTISSVITISANVGGGSGSSGDGAQITITDWANGEGAHELTQYAGNINGRVQILNAVLSGAGDSVNANNLSIQWYKAAADTVDPADPSKITWTGTSRNVQLVKETLASASGSLFFVLPSSLPQSQKETDVSGTKEKADDSTHFYFARASVRTAKGNVIEALSALYTVTVRPRPVISVSAVSPVTGILADADSVETVKLKISATVAPSCYDADDLKFQWFMTNKDGAYISEVAGVDDGEDEYAFDGVGLKPGYYYYRAEVSLDPEVADAASVKSITFPVTVTPTESSRRLLAAKAEFKVYDKTLDYAVPSEITKLEGGKRKANNSGTKLRIDIPTTSANLVSGEASGYNWRVSEISYTKVLPVANGSGEPDFTATMDVLGAPTGSYTDDASGIASASKYNHGVENAGTYSVEVTLLGWKSGTTPDSVFTTKFVKLTVKPKQLSTLSTFTVKAPVGDTIFDGSAKTPMVELKDGTYTLRQNVDFHIRPPKEAGNWINAGTATVQVTGVAGVNADDYSTDVTVDGNYAGDRLGSFVIRKRPITINPTGTVVDGKSYDGTDTLSASSINVAFNSTLSFQELKKGEDYIVSGQKFDDKNVGLRTVSNIAVRLDTLNSVIARNYTFGAVGVAPVVSATFSKVGVEITKAEPDAKFLSYSVPTTHIYNGKERGIGAVGWAAGVTNPGGVLEVYYAKEGDAMSKDLPIDSVTYDLSVLVRGGSNFNDGTVPLPIQYTIRGHQPLWFVTKPTLKGDNAPQDTMVYLGMSLSLKATANRPDSSFTYALGANGDTLKTTNSDGEEVDSVIYNYFKGGTISYQWFKVSKDAEGNDVREPLKNNGATTDTYKLPLPLKETGETPETYTVRAVWKYDAVTTPDTSFADIRVTVGPEPASIADADISVTGGPFVYDGKRKVIYPENLTVTMGTVTLTDSVDFTFDYFGLNAGVGAGTVTITGINGYKGTKIGYFDIDKIVTDESVLSFGTTTQYNDSVQEFSVTAKGGLLGLGTVTKKYFTVDEDGKETALAGAPKAVGNYVVKVEIAEGTNFTAMEEFEKPYSIVKRALTKNDFTYTLPEEHAYTGVAKPAVTATLKSTVKGFTGTTSVVYFLGNTRLTEMPVDEGTYEVMVDVVGDDNFSTTMVVLGNYVIHEEDWVIGVKSSDREIPTKPVVEEAAVAPVKVVASGFTAGPNPVSKGGVIKFFSTKPVKSGSLYIFDKNGNSVAKLSATAGAGEIGKWTANVSEGTYVVKGALTGKDGAREKVSFVFVVVR